MMEKQPRKAAGRRQAFSLVELLVSVSIIASLMGLLVSAVQKLRGASATSICGNNLRQLALACRGFADGHRGRLPPGGAGTYVSGDNRGSWLVYVLPYIEQAPLAAQIGIPESPNSVGNAISAKILPAPLGPIARCPADDFVGSQTVCNYVGSLGPQCVSSKCGSTGPYFQYCNPPASWDWNYALSAPNGNSTAASDIRGTFNRYGAIIRVKMITDGLSNTLLIGESLPYQHPDLYDTNNWAHQNSGNANATTIIPINYVCDYHDPAGNGCTNPTVNYENWTVSWGFRSRHPGGANFVFGDGGVHFLRQDIDPRTYNLLGCRNDDRVPGSYE
jgi:prepilin-type N-terminal cleavage/methylation domain-containing protein/prepilin-type processing-associated H-X9-DG protein